MEQFTNRLQTVTSVYKEINFNSKDLNDQEKCWQYPRKRLCEYKGCHQGPGGTNRPHWPWPASLCLFRKIPKMKMIRWWQNIRGKYHTCFICSDSYRCLFVACIRDAILCRMDCGLKQHGDSSVLIPDRLLNVSLNISCNAISKMPFFS